MRSSTPGLAAFLCALALILFPCGEGHAQLVSGQPAPLFSLEDLQGGVYNLSDLMEDSTLILYFCDVGSPSSQDGLLALDKAVREYPGSGISIWGVALSTVDQVKEFSANHGLAFPLLPDTAGIGVLYQVKAVLPMTYLIRRGEGGVEVSDFIQGGGKTTEVLLDRLIKGSSMMASQGNPPTRFQELKAKGIKEFEQKDYQAAYTDLSEALSLEPDADTFLYIAYTLMELKKDQEVEESLSKAIQAYPEDLRIYKVYIKYLLAHDQKQKAKSLLDRALGLNPDDPTLISLKEIAAAEKGKP